MRKDVKTDATRKTLETADHQLQAVRDSAVKAIRATNTCAKNDDEDKDNDEDKDEDSGKHSQTNFILAFFQKFLGKDATVTIVTASASPTASPAPTVAPSPTPSASTSTVAFTGTDPKAIADQAVAAMKLIFDNAKTQLPTSTAPPRRPRTHRPK